MVFSQSTTTTFSGIDIPNIDSQSSTSFFNHSSELSPRSSSPTSSAHSSDQSTRTSPPRSRSSSPGLPIPSSPPPRVTRTRVITELKANFTVEEFGERDYEDFDSDVDSIIRPTQYEDADSDRAESIRSQSRLSAHFSIDPRILQSLNNLQCENSDDDGDLAHEAYIQMKRAEKRRKRRSSASFKRSLAQSIGSDTDDEDLIPGLLDANDAGSSARRLRRRLEERSSLIFDDPPPRIDELEEPESCEEVVEVAPGEEEMEGLASLFWVQQEEMDVDTSSEEEDSDNE